jgi:hypothetical protein
MQARLTTKPEHEVIAAIQALDLESVKSRVMDTELGEGWSREYADSIETAYKTYLTMLVKYPDDAEDILLSKDVDEFWHTHILQTRKYREDCQKTFGNFLHHEPHVGRVSAEDHEKRTVQAEKTRSLYEREFGNMRKAEAAWSGYAISARQAAFSAAAIQAGKAAFSAAGVRAERAAFSAASIQTGSAAFSAASVRAENAAFSAASIRTGSAAFSAASMDPKAAAFSAASVRAENAAFSAASIRAGSAAFSAAAIRPEAAAFSAAGLRAGNAAFSAASLQPAKAAFSAASVKG